jgi:hypothetical protein
MNKLGARPPVYGTGGKGQRRLVQSYKEYGRTVKRREVDKERMISTMEQTIGDGTKTLGAKNSNKNTHQLNSQ